MIVAIAALQPTAKWFCNWAGRVPDANYLPMMYSIQLDAKSP